MLSWVLVFKTNIAECESADALNKLISSIYPTALINFDLNDCDRILRVEGNDINASVIIKTLQESGFECIELE